MKRIKKATPTERTAYLRTNPVHPLHGWLVIDGHRCAVEDMRATFGREDGPVWAALAPHGLHFPYDDVHSLNAWTLRELEQRAHGETLAQCEPECGCGFDLREAAND